MKVSMRKLYLALAGRATRLFSAFRASPNEDHLLEEIGKADKHVERLSKRLFYCKDLREVADITKNAQDLVSDLREIQTSLEPVADSLNQYILATGAIRPPERMTMLMRQNPWSVLDQIRPAPHNRPHSNPDMVPLFFMYRGILFVGWQMAGVIRNLLDIEVVADESIGGVDVVTQKAAPPSTTSNPIPTRNVIGSAPFVVTVNLSKAENLAAQRLQEGASPRQVVESLTARGLKRGVAKDLVSEVSQELLGKVRSEE